jgi:hypothetical protein
MCGRAEQQTIRVSSGDEAALVTQGGFSAERYSCGMITLGNLDEICTYHKWSPEQIERGTKIRAAGKELMRAILESDVSDPYLEDADYNKTLAGKRRQAALEMANDAVMKANSAITLEANAAGAEKTW